MSASPGTNSQQADAASALAAYDQTRRPDLLRQAADVAAREDGNPPADPAAAPAEARARVETWIDILSRFRRDLDPNFNPDQPPSTVIQAPVVHGRILMPYQRPSDLKDPEERAALEKVIADRNEAVARYDAMATLAAVHDEVLEKAAHSLRDAREVLGLSVAEIDALIANADILPKDRSTLHDAIAL
jgi:hypothetical protein